MSAGLLTWCPPCTGNALPADSRRAMRAAAMLLRAGGGDAAESPSKYLHCLTCGYLVSNCMLGAGEN